MVTHFTERRHKERMARKSVAGVGVFVASCLVVQPGKYIKYKYGAIGKKFLSQIYFLIIWYVIYLLVELTVFYLHYIVRVTTGIAVEDNRQTKQAAYL